MPDPEMLSDGKVEIETKSVGKDDSSRLRSVKMNMEKAVSSYTDVDGMSLTDSEYHMLYFIVREWWRDVTHSTNKGKFKLDAVIKTQWGDFRTEVDAGHGGMKVIGSNYRNFLLGVVSPHVEGFAIGVILKKNKQVLDIAKSMLSDEIKKETANKLSEASTGMKLDLLKKSMPVTFGMLRNYTRNPAAIYDFVSSGDGGTLDLGSHREVIDESRHWANVMDYPITLRAKPAKSMEFADLFTDSRFTVAQGNGIQSGFEI
jgi:hypothetical protein